MPRNDRNTVGSRETQKGMGKLAAWGLACLAAGAISTAMAGSMELAPLNNAISGSTNSWGVYFGAWPTTHDSLGGLAIAGKSIAELFSSMNGGGDGLEAVTLAPLDPVCSAAVDFADLMAGCSKGPVAPFSPASRSDGSLSRVPLDMNCLLDANFQPVDLQIFVGSGENRGSVSAAADSGVFRPPRGVDHPVLAMKGLW